MLILCLNLEQECHETLVSGDPNFFDICVHGRRWTSDCISRISDLPSEYLSVPQMGELMCAYEHEGQHELQTQNVVHYYNSVSYMVKGRAVEEGQEDSLEGEDDLVQVRVHAGDIIEFKAEGEPEGRGFGEVVAVMKHMRSIFLIVRWIVATGSNHPKFELPQFRKLAVFEEFRPGIFSISLIDGPKFVNRIHFVDNGNGVLVRNDWIFSVV